MKAINQKNNLLVDNYIVFVLFIFILVFNALKTLFELFTYGILKKEILTLKSDLGFDLKIRMK